MQSNAQKSDPQSAIPLGAAAQFALSAYEKIVGYEYSEFDIKRLVELKHLFQEILQNTAPISWELDDKKRPTHRISHHKWSDHVRQLAKGKHQIGRFHYQSSLIAEYAATYLAERGKRWIGSGRSGDLLEQFISEWIHFAIYELPSLSFDEESLQKIKQRIKYLEKIQKHEFLFKFGTITRRRNKFDTIESIKQQLYSSIELISKEALRQCAREKLEICCANSAGLLLAYAKATYYGRATVIYHEPLELQSFVDPDNAFLTTSSKKTYPKIMATHSGAILHEVICLAGLEAFGAVGVTPKKPLKASYFEESFAPKKVEWATKDFDLPPWINKAQAISYIMEHQQVAESALRVARLKNLVEIAYDLTGKIGDLWAYGDAEGKLSLNGLLFLLEKELDNFYQRFDHLYQFQNRQRHIYNLRYRVNPDNEINLNFNKVDEQHEDISKFYNLLKKAIKGIHDRMADYTEEDTRKINTKKTAFYKSVSNYMKQYYPEHCYKYELLMKASQVQGDSEYTQNELEALVEEESYSFCKSVNMEQQETEASKTAKAWKREFVFLYKKEHLELQKLKQEFRKKIDAQMPFADIRSSAMALKKQVDLLKVKAELERPVWSFGSIGWPFKKNTRAKVDHMVNALDTLLKEVGASLGDETILLNNPGVATPSSSAETMAALKNKEKERLSQKRFEPIYPETPEQFAKMMLLEGDESTFTKEYKSKRDFYMMVYHPNKDKAAPAAAAKKQGSVLEMTKMLKRR
jgi:hypothetical protein